MGHNILEQRAKQRQTPPGETNSTHAARHLALRGLCLLGLGAALSACPSSTLYPDFGDDKDALRGVRIVSFDKNGGDIEAVPESIALRPPATTVERLPEPPTRVGYKFVEWNTEKDGGGNPFTEQTPVTANILLVYAQWALISDVRPVVTVAFDRNGGDTEAAPTHKTIIPPATSLNSLPVPPTRAGYQFAGWNTERDGRGSPFTAQTSVDAATSRIVVYAQWDRSLSLHLLHDTLTFTPLVGGDSITFTVMLSGFKNADDAGDVGLGVGGSKTWFSLHFRDSHFLEGTKIFAFRIDYSTTTFTEGPASIHFNPGNVPKGYAYVDGPQTLYVAAANGLEKTRPIPVNEGNIKTFNDYANTNEGRKRHYQLTGNVHLTPPEKGKSNWTAIGKNTAVQLFTGSFDGNDFRIFDLTIHAPDGDFQGLFGYIDEGAEIKNLGLEGVSVRGREYVGSLAGYNRGTVHNSYAAGSVEGINQVGGLVGWNSGAVRSSYATGSVKGGNQAGGLMGVNSATVQNSYATCSVKGDSSVGGLLGHNLGTVQNSYAAGSVDGKSSVGGLVGWNWTADRVQNNVALNPSIIATGSNIGRVVGVHEGGGSLSGNRARNDMKLERGGIPYVPTVANSQANMKDGAGTAAFNTRDFWTTTLSSWDFAADGHWEWQEGFLPTLRNVGGEQKPRVQEVP